MARYQKIKKVSDKDPLTPEDLDNALELLMECEKIMANKSLMATIKAYGEKKIAQIDSLKKLRKIADEVRSKDEV